MRKKPSFIALVVILLGLIVLKLWDAKLFDIYPYLEVSRITYFSLLSIIIAILGTLSLNNKSKRSAVIRFCLILVAAFGLSFLFIKRSDFEKIDYLFSTPIESFKHEKEVGRAFWSYHTFIVDSDTINLSQNSRREEIYQGEFSVYKSSLTQQYYIRPKTK